MHINIIKSSVEKQRKTIYTEEHKEIIMSSWFIFDNLHIENDIIIIKDEKIEKKFNTLCQIVGEDKCTPIDEHNCGVFNLLLGYSYSFICIEDNNNIIHEALKCLKVSLNNIDNNANVKIKKYLNDFEADLEKLLKQKERITKKTFEILWNDEKLFKSNLTEKQKNEISAEYNLTFIKFINDEMSHNNFQYSLGLNIDTVPFSPTPTCKSGGLYFTSPQFENDFKNYGKKYKIKIPDDATVYFDHQNKAKADKIIVEVI